MNFDHRDHSASGRVALNARGGVAAVLAKQCLGIDPGELRLDAKAVAMLFRVSLPTARRRLASWHAAPAGTAPQTKKTPRVGRRGRSSYFTTRDELARFYPEINDG